VVLITQPKKEEEEVMRVSTKKMVLLSVLSLVLSTSFQACGKEKGPDLSKNTDTPAPVEAKKVEVTEASFKCLHEMTKVGDMYVDNLLGDLDATLAVAKSAAGGTYPPGSVVQLFPVEAMVKLEKGAHPSTNDWKFFTLDVSPEGHKITQEGFEEVKNPLGTCISCHQQPSAPQADMICAAGNACPPVVFPGINSEDLIPALQKMDQRCPRPDLLTDQEKIALKQFVELQAKLKAQAAAAGGQQ
jgi:hypothetical protein